MRAIKRNIQEIIKELEEQGKVIPATTDAVFKALFQDISQRDNLAFIINEVTKLNKEYVLKHMVFGNSEIPKNNVTLKSNTTDLLVNVLDKCILLEMNQFNNYDNEFRNNAHFYATIANSIKVADDYSKIKQIYQINFDNEKVFSDNLISEIMFIDIDTGRIDDKNYKKYRINLVKLREKYYNNFSKLTRFEKLLLILQLDSKEELRKLARGDEGLMEMVDKIEDMSKDPDILSFYDEEKLNKLAQSVYEHKIKEDIREEVKKEVAEEVKKEVTEEVKNEVSYKTRIETAKKLLEKGLNVDDIIEITCLPKKEIDALK